TGATSYQWYSNNSAILGATSQTLQVTSAATYTVTASANDYTTPQSAGYVVQNPTPHKPVVSANGPTTFCQGGSVTLSSNFASGNQWYLNGNAINGATNQTFNATTPGDYTVVVTTSGCSSATSAKTTVSANPSPVLSYAAPPAVTLNGSLTINPATGPSDNTS